MGSVSYWDFNSFLCNTFHLGFSWILLMSWLTTVVMSAFWIGQWIAGLCSHLIKIALSDPFRTSSIAKCVTPLSIRESFEIIMVNKIIKTIYHHELLEVISSCINPFFFCLALSWNLNHIANSPCISCSRLLLAKNLWTPL